jgi:hypothetical protein
VLHHIEHGIEGVLHQIEHGIKVASSIEPGIKGATSKIWNRGCCINRKRNILENPASKCNFMYFSTNHPEKL